MTSLILKFVFRPSIIALGKKKVEIWTKENIFVRKSVGCRFDGSLIIDRMEINNNWTFFQYLKILYEKYELNFIPKFSFNCWCLFITNRTFLKLFSNQLFYIMNISIFAPPNNVVFSRRIIHVPSFISGIAWRIIIKNKYIYESRIYFDYTNPYSASCRSTGIANGNRLRGRNKDSHFVYFQLSDVTKNFSFSQRSTVSFCWCENILHRLDKSKSFRTFEIFSNDLLPPSHNVVWKSNNRLQNFIAATKFSLSLRKLI